ncbi:helix-turn-helix transcriptional regulator [Anaeromicropila populeti]|uniref:Regulatory protein, luxR family n=1 Tax=Anaeromicropila populeti TaxID=37658 RepID=A0A1I6IDD2_9FIRM|nr:helix-turn-helix transcriptional regulator [Anaeromicropila populeti]SFR64629.1 regulatory protein, luxR family [Anaeromicropila populeti]
MKQFETNEWLLINNMIYKIYTTDNFDEMRKELLEQLRMVVHFDSADFFLATSKGTNGLCSPITFNCDSERSIKYDELDYSRGIMYGGKSIVYRETDIISDDNRIHTEYYKKVYKPNSWHYSLQIILARKKKFLGVITLYRLIGKENFEYGDVFLLDMLKDHIAYRLSTEVKRQINSLNKISVSEAASQYDLTKREETILRLLMKGEDSETISRELVITVNTLKKHVLNIYRKLGINNRVQMFKMIRESE